VGGGGGVGVVGVGGGYNHYLSLSHGQNHYIPRSKPLLISLSHGQNHYFFVYLTVKTTTSDIKIEPEIVEKPLLTVKTTTYSRSKPLHVTVKTTTY